MRCINNKPDKEDPLADLLVEGRVYRIATAGIRYDGARAIAFRCLPTLEDPSKGYAFTTKRFRRLLQADDTFTAKIRACRPVRESEPA